MNLIICIIASLTGTHASGSNSDSDSIDMQHAPLNDYNDHGQTPLILACLHNNYRKIMRLVGDARVDIDKPERDTNIPPISFMIESIYGAMRKGAVPISGGSWNLSPDEAKRLAEERTLVKQRARDEKSTMENAIRHEWEDSKEYKELPLARDAPDKETKEQRKKDRRAAFELFRESRVSNHIPTMKLKSTPEMTKTHWQEFAIDAFQAILDREPKLDTVSSSGWTPLGKAVYYASVKDSYPIRVVESLLIRGCDGVNSFGGGAGPLHYAASARTKDRAEELVTLLITHCKKSLNFALLDSKGLSALAVAQFLDNTQAAQLLKPLTHIWTVQDYIVWGLVSLLIVGALVTAAVLLWIHRRRFQTKIADADANGKDPCDTEPDTDGRATRRDTRRDTSQDAE